jgi:imidazolonepropionase-like amidohydrolase
MNLQQIIDHLDLKPLTQPISYTEVQPTSGYASDLLSCVMAGAKSNGIWVTLQAHQNIVAVAALLEMSAVIITEGATPDSATIAKANDQSIVLLSTSRPSFDVIGELWQMGLRSAG